MRPIRCSPSSRIADTRSTFDACSAGTSPDRTAVTNERPAVKASARPSRASDTSIGTGSAGKSNTSAVVIQRASSTPAVPPRTNSSIVSTSSCRTSRARPAPMARRMAISRRRTEPRARRTPVRFVQATASTIETIPRSRARKAASGPRRSGVGDNAAARNRLPRLASGSSCSRARLRVSSSAVAPPIEIPGFSRAPIKSDAPTRFRSSGDVRASIGTQASGERTVVP